MITPSDGDAMAIEAAPPPAAEWSHGDVLAESYIEVMNIGSRSSRRCTVSYCFSNSWMVF
jgi:hypothetical protein